MFVAIRTGRRPRFFLLAFTMVVGFLFPLPAIDADEFASGETLLVQQPAVSRTHVVFVYANDLWIVSRSGGVARRLTSDVGVESRPRISPDGRWVAFSGQYEGNTDVYLLSVDGGTPRRLTWHPGSDFVQDWHPDGRRILFSSARSSTAPVYRLFLVSREGGTPTGLEVPRVSHACYNSDASRIAYTPYFDAFRTWKRYRGGRVTRTWIYDVANHDVEVVPHVNASDTFPCFLGSDVYFASDRDRQMNLWRYSPGSATLTQITHFKEFDVRNMSAGGGVIALEQGGSIHIYDPVLNRLDRLSITVQSDGLAGRARWQAVKGHVRNASIAPNGKRAVFEARGEIITVPKEHGNSRNITQSPAAHDREPTWSPDGKDIAWFSDEGGEYRLMVRDRLGREKPRAFELGGASFYYDPRWSPDGTHILFRDKANRTAFLTIESGEVTEVAQNQGTLGVLSTDATWSPDSKWIAFESRNERTMYDRIALYNVADKTTTLMTDAFGEASDPAFSRDGKYLFFSASIDSGPNLFGLDMNSSASRRNRSSLYLAVLKADEKNPLAPKSDEGFEETADKEDDKEDGEDDKEDGEDSEKETPEEDDGEDDDGEDEGDESGSDSDDAGEGVETGKGDEEDTKEGESSEDDEEKSTEDDEPSIDLEGLDQRILSLPIPTGRFGTLGATKDKLLYIEFPMSGPPELKSFDFDKREPKSLAKNIFGFMVSSDGKSLLTAGSDGFYLTDASGENKKRLSIDNVKVRVVPNDEWRQVLREAWRLERDYFYDPAMHGVDWAAMWTRWSAFLPYVRHRSDLNLLIGEMIGELACGHNYVGGGDQPSAASGVSVGLLGADFVIDSDKFRFARIYPGQNWNPGLRSPLTEPGVDIKEGDYLISVDGREITSDENLYSAFENTAGRQIDIGVVSDLEDEVRHSTVVPIRSAGSLRRLAWIEANRRRVDELSSGRLAYIYMPDTGGAGRRSFDRDFFSQLDKEGVILDERFNRGGQVADYVVQVLSREVMCYWMNREQWVAQTPFGTLPGPKVMVINERAGSGGDCMPWMFSNKKIGPLVGRRTWGGLVGISGYPPLMDGGSVTAASFGVMDVDGNWAVENVGVSPDYEVVQWPKDVIAGGDPQLEKAVAVAMDLLKRQPAKKPPTYRPPTAR